MSQLEAQTCCVYGRGQVCNYLLGSGQKENTGVAAVRFLRGTLFAEVRLGITDLRVKSAVRQKRHYALFAAIRMKPNYALFSL